MQFTLLTEEGRYLLCSWYYCKGSTNGFLMATTYFLVNIYIKGVTLAPISYVRDLFVQAGISTVLALIVVKAVKKALPQL